MVRSLPMVRRWYRPYGTTVNKSECSKQALSMGIYPQFCLNDLAWDCLGAVNSAFGLQRLLFTGACNVKQGEGSSTMVLEVKFRYQHMTF